MTLTRAGSDSATVSANIPKVSSSSAGVAPKGEAVSSQTQSTKFLRSDGSWAAPSYTVNTDTNTWRKVQLNGTDKLGTGTSTNPLNIKAGSNMSITESSGTFTFAATDTTYGAGTADLLTAGTDTANRVWSAKILADRLNAALTSVLKYKGTIGSSGATVTALPATHAVGDVYVVSVAGTYAGKAVEVGDYIICRTAGTSANDAHWDVVNGENQVSNKAVTLAWGTSKTIATIDGTDITVSLPANPNTDTDTHYTTGINAGASDATSNSAQTNPYITVKDNSTYRSQIRLVGGGATSISSDANGNITISSTDTNTNTTYSAGTGLNLSGTTFSAKLKDATANSADSSKSTSSNGGLYAVEVDKSGYLAVRVPWVNTDTNTTYSAGTGLSLNGTEFSLATSGVTAGTYKRVTVDAYGRVTSGDNTDANDNTARLQVSDTTNKRINTKESTGNYIQFTGGTDKFTVTDGTNSFDVAVSHTNDGDTKNTTGTSNKASTKLFLAGAESQAANPVTYSNANCYIGTDNCLYSNGAKVLTSHDGNTTYKFTIGSTTKGDSTNGVDLGTLKSETAAANGTTLSLVTTGEKDTWNAKTSNTGTVTSVAAGTGLSGGTITTSGTLSVSYGTTAGTACQGNDSRLSNSRPASDVYSWAKASTKPSYTLSEVGASSSVSAITANTSSSCSITGSSNAGKIQTIIYTNSSGSDLTVTVPTTYKTPDGAAIELTCPNGGYCEVNYINIGGTIYARGL